MEDIASRFSIRNLNEDAVPSRKIHRDGSAVRVHERSKRDINATHANCSKIGAIGGNHTFNKGHARYRNVAAGNDGRPQLTYGYSPRKESIKEHSRIATHRHIAADFQCATNGNSANSAGAIGCTNRPRCANSASTTTMMRTVT